MPDFNENARVEREDHERRERKMRGEYRRCPLLGDTVHFVLRNDDDFGAQVRAAMVVTAFDGMMTCELAVFPNTFDHDLSSASKGTPNFLLRQGIYEETGKIPGTWHWPHSASR